MLDEAERSLHDALCVLSQTVVDRRVLLGGGWPEMAMSHAVHTQVSCSGHLDTCMGLNGGVEGGRGGGGSGG